MAIILLAVVFDVPAPGVRSFQAYEATVLPLLQVHGGELQRRLRNADGTREVHIVRFGSQVGFTAFRDDPRRAAAAGLLDASGARSEVIEVVDV